MLAALQRRLDALALDQLRARCAEQAEYIERLTNDYNNAAADADWWRDQAIEQNLREAAATGGRPGLTQSGALVVVT